MRSTRRRPSADAVNSTPVRIGRASSFDAAGTTIWVSSAKDSDRARLVAISTDTGEQTVLDEDEVADLKAEVERLRAELAAAFGPKTKAILLNTPMNPASKVFTRSELEFIAGLLQQPEAASPVEVALLHRQYIAVGPGGFPAEAVLRQHRCD